MHQLPAVVKTRSGPEPPARAQPRAGRRSAAAGARVRRDPAPTRARRARVLTD